MLAGSGTAAGLATSAAVPEPASITLLIAAISSAGRSLAAIFDGPSDLQSGIAELPRCHRLDASVCQQDRRGEDHGSMELVVWPSNETQAQQGRRSRGRWTKRPMSVRGAFGAKALARAADRRRRLCLGVKPITVVVGAGGNVSTTGDYEGGGTTGTSYGNPYTIVLDSETGARTRPLCQHFQQGGDPTADGFVTAHWMS